MVVPPGPIVPTWLVLGSVSASAVTRGSLAQRLRLADALGGLAADPQASFHDPATGPLTTITLDQATLLALDLRPRISCPLVAVVTLLVLEEAGQQLSAVISRQCAGQDARQHVGLEA